MKMDGTKIIRIEGFAGGIPCPIAGRYVVAFDFDAYGGRGSGEFSVDLAKAKRFEDLFAAIEFWRTQSKTHPLREDGLPNRPLTAASVSFEDAPQ